ncbi:MAG: PilZ domain-containing protein [Deltaproteobacteria bacterium]|nr:PilZ domain-containing protein [Deltaproteobacteria bacterium]
MAERRKHKRYCADQNTFAVLRSKQADLEPILNKSMAEVAMAVFRSKPVRMGRVLDISKGGLSFSYPETKQHPRQSLGLEILLADCGFYLEKVPFKVVSDIKMPHEIPKDSITNWRCSVKFGTLKQNQAARLHHFLTNHTMGSA